MTRKTHSATPEISRSGIDVFSRGLMAALDRLPLGELTLRWPDGRVFVFRGTSPGPSARATIHDPACVRRAILGGSIGLGEGYMAAEWDTPDLTNFLEFAAANLDAVSGPAWMRAPRTPIYRIKHALRSNTRTGSRKNIEHHYDLGNSFYELWLDPDMTYSCGLFDGTECDLTVAQGRKWDRLLGLLDITPGDSLLEIGCGWGGFAIHAAKTTGARVTGLTISQEQFDWATRRVAEVGLGDQIEIRLQDYRDVTGTFDHIVSIEMFEAVGERFWPTFFRTVRDRLAAGGRAALQTITIEDARLEEYRANPDFIQRFIFPGGMLPSPERFDRVARAAGLRVSEPFLFGSDYAMTLHAWEERFADAVQRVRALGFDERFERLWRFYLSYCQVGFRRGSVNVMQVALERV